MNESVESPSGLEKVWRMLFETTDALRSFQEKSISQLIRPGTTIAQLRVVSTVAHAAPAPVRVKDLADELSLTPGRISQQVDALVRAGVLDRGASADDRRSVGITLSPQGLTLLEEIGKYFSDVTGRLLGEVPEAERKTFVKVLEHLATALDNERRQLRKQRTAGATLPTVLESDENKR